MDKYDGPAFFKQNGNKKLAKDSKHFVSKLNITKQNASKNSEGSSKSFHTTYLSSRLSENPKKISNDSSDKSKGVTRSMNRSTSPFVREIQKFVAEDNARQKVKNGVRKAQSIRQREIKFYNNLKSQLKISDSDLIILANNSTSKDSGPNSNHSDFQQNLFENKESQAIKNRASNKNHRGLGQSLEKIVDSEQSLAKPISYFEAKNKDSVENPDKATKDELIPRILEFISKENTISVSKLQRVFSIGYNRATGIISYLEANHFISKANGSSPRKVLYREKK